METKQPRGKFVFIDDDPDEHELFRLATESLGIGSQLKMFRDGTEALDYLRATDDEIFVILSDLNMPLMDGLQLKRLIDSIPELKIKAIPFYFFSNTSTAAEIRTAYAENIQGFLRKTARLEDTTESLKKIIALWMDCVHPKDFGRRVY